MLPGQGHLVLPVVMTLYRIVCVQDHSTFKLLLSMAHMVVSPYCKVCESFVTLMAHSQIGPLFMAHLVVLLNISFIAALGAC